MRLNGHPPFEPGRSHSHETASPKGDVFAPLCVHPVPPRKQGDFVTTITETSQREESPLVGRLGTNAAPAEQVRAELSPGLAGAKRIGLVLIGLQLTGMLAFSSFQYSRYAVAYDFSAYSQAWWKIAHGNVDPWSTVVGVAFWKNNAEFLMWPLSVLYHVFPQPILLLWIQDLVVVATEVVTFLWILDITTTYESRISKRVLPFIPLGAVLVMLMNPWCYQTVVADFHFEPFVALFVILAARDLWAGTSRVWCWVVLALLSDSLGALCVLGLGLSGVLAGQRTRRTGLLLGATALIWLVFLSIIGAAGVGGSLLSSGYGYLAGTNSGHTSVINIVIGALHHPGSVAHMLGNKWPILFEFVVVVGLVGLFSPWGIGVPLMVFLPTMLSADPQFFRLYASFQSWPALPFVLVGSVFVLLRLTASNELGRRTAAVIVGVWATVLIIITAATLPNVLRTGVGVNSAVADQLQQIEKKIPARAEVIASIGVSGRFADHDYAYPYPRLSVAATSSTTYRVASQIVVFVFAPRTGQDVVSSKEAAGAVSFLERILHARVLDRTANAQALEWSPSKGTRSVKLPQGN
jgi:uncharacterized membrane protein